jgi:carbonic anhydrase/acetyltransferase-like protein (isoleucine patch superfamily)
LIEHQGNRPTVAASAYVAPYAVLCGDVSVGDESRILFGAVLTAGSGRVEVGERCIVMEQALIRGRAGHPTRLGNHVLIGPHAHVNGATIKDNAFLATGVAVFAGAHVGSRAEIRINAVVHVNSTVAPETVVPIGWITVGDPAELFPPTGTRTCGRSSANSTSRARSLGSHGRKRKWTASPSAMRSCSAPTAQIGS